SASSHAGESRAEHVSARRLSPPWVSPIWSDAVSRCSKTATSRDADREPHGLCNQALQHIPSEDFGRRNSANAIGPSSGVGERNAEVAHGRRTDRRLYFGWARFIDNCLVRSSSN